ncbi:MAG: hypothetical protein EZS28_029569 [Streblomastix strix]|uniref:Uncharacterized protein n=1 Tax=Streblomastix strix TaxID=222440 RepID=A0A5J4UYS9_9EUKA|nr:MAG: hypothetical protein EZS28_029569 [Streblomastix strix]
MPDQVTPASDATPLSDGSANAGISNQYSRGDHVHPLNIKSTIPPSDNASGSVGTSNYYAKATSGNLQINATSIAYDDGLRISRSVQNTGGSSIFLVYSRDSNIETIANQWQIFTPPSSYVNNPIGLNISLSADSSDTSRDLQISADGNTFSFNGQIIAGTGASNGSVNYSQRNAILWGTKSLGTDGDFYTNGTTVFWRDHALQFDPYNKG